MWEGFTSGLSNLGTNIGNMFSGTPATVGMQNLPNLSNFGVSTTGLATQQVDPSLFGGMKDFLTSKGGQGLMKTGFEGFNALNNYKMGNKQMDLANKQFGIQQDAYATDKRNAENRQNLRF